MLIPYVVENDGGRERSYDLWSRLMSDRIVFLSGTIEETQCALAIAQLLYLESVDSEKPINLYVMSFGGSVLSGNALIDTMRFLKCKVNTICLGYCMSMGAMILAAGTGTRSALPESRIMIHELSSGNSRSSATDLEISMKETLYLKDRLNDMLATFTKQPLEVIQKEMVRDKYMSAEEAKDFGIIDEVINPRETK